LGAHRHRGAEAAAQDFAFGLVPEQHHQRLMHRIRRVERAAGLG
jgi:hypothetical protein